MEVNRIFDIVSTKVVINENILLIPWLKVIKETYKEYINAFCYIHYYTDPTGAYYVYEEDIRKEKLLKDFPGDYKPTDKIIANAIKELYDRRVLNNTIIRHWSSCKSLLDKFSAYADSVILDDTKDGNMAHAQRILDKIEKNMKMFISATKLMEEEQAKTRGNRKRAYDE